ncbi:hypothetical protein FRC02_001404 [Tulasnella sp. 418]|nr:hypothetical protein FRC02_001404 [Tulasnella sp. 418]
MEDPLSSSQAFIRALKAASDPPTPFSSSKIEIATQAWAKESLYVPGKHTVIVEWILGKLLKERELDSGLNPLLKPRYWTLLASIIIEGDRKAANIWLPPILSRIPVLPIMASFIKRLPQLQHSSQLNAIGKLFRVWLSLALPRASQEAILELYWNTLASLSLLLYDKPTNDCLSLMTSCIEAFRTAFAHPSMNKKKVHVLFIQDHLSDWLHSFFVLKQHQPTAYPLLYNSGEDILFSPEALKVYINMYSSGNDVTSSQSPEGDLVQSVQDFLATKSLLAIVGPSPSAVAFPIIPSLFQSFVSSIQKHKSLLFGQGMPADKSSQRDGQVDRTLAMNKKLKQASITFLNRLYSGPLGLSHMGSEGSAVLTKVQLLRFLEEHGGLYDNADVASKTMMKEQAQLSVSSLAKGQFVSSTLEYLTVILKLDFDVVEPMLPSILKSIALCTKDSLQSALAFLSPLLEYRSKTRTLQNHIISMVDCFKEVAQSSSDSKNAFHHIVISPLFNIVHQLQLQRSTKSFLTSLQTIQVVRSLKIEITACWNRAVESTIHNPSQLAARADTHKLALLVEFSIVLLPFIPVDSLSPHSSEELRQEIHYIRDMLIQPSTVSALIKRSLLVQEPPSSPKKKRKIKEGVAQPISSSLPSADSSWPAQLLLQSVLRFEYMIRRSYEIFRLGTEAPEERLDGSLLLELMESNQTLGGLRLEIVRILLSRLGDKHNSSLSHLSEDSAYIRVINICLDQVENLVLEPKTDNTPKRSWNGEVLGVEKSCETTFSVAIWDMFLGRWLGVIDQRATPEQLSRLARVAIQSFKQPTSPPASVQNFTIHDVLSHKLTLASFWEHRRLRDAFFLLIENITKPLDDGSTPSLLKRIFDNSSHDEPVSIGRFDTALLPLFRLLLHAPSEFLPRSIKVQLANCSIAYDVALSVASQTGDETTGSTKKLMRTTILKIVRDVGCFEVFANPADVAMYFISPLPGSKFLSVDDLTDKTLDLVKLIQKAIVTKTGQDGTSIMQIMKYYLQLKPFAINNTTSTSTSLQRAGLLGLLETISSVDASSISLPAQELVLDLTRHISACAEPILRKHMSDPSTSMGSHGSEALRAWRISRMVRQWLGKNLDKYDTELSMSNLSQRLSGLSISKLVSDPNGKETVNLCTETFAFLLSELRMKDRSSNGEPRGDDSLHTLVELFVAAYVAIAVVGPGADSIATSTLQSIDEICSNDTKSWSMHMFSITLDVIKCDLDGADTLKDSTAKRSRLLRLSNLLFKYSPQGSRAPTQQLLSSWMIHIAGWGKGVFLTDRIALVDMLVFLKDVSTERASILRALDVSHMLSILSAVLAPRKAGILPSRTAIPSGATSSFIFTLITNILTLIVRHRRDLVKLYLPHLAQVLTLSIKTLRTLRPGVLLGGKQSQLVANTLPWWISLEHGDEHQQLNSESARHLGRVLSAIGAKSVVLDGGHRKQHEHSSEATIQSLGKPFSKHAASVLMAYAITVSGSDSDMLTTLDRSTREGLEEGIYTLCSIVGEHGRDWVMENLNVDGKRIFKSLWSDYEKQRYVGRG